MITLSSDFGSPYPAAMKGVVLSRTDTTLVDIAHDFPRHDVRTTAFWLREILPWFPPAVHLVVVDPGVGTDRAALVMRAGAHALVGPDNGVLLPCARRLAGAEGDAVEAFEIRGLSPASDTFHGRDVFAPAAAMVETVGIDHAHELDILAPTEAWTELTFPDPAIEADRATGEVLAVDGFGNVITNLPGRLVEDAMGGTIRVNATSYPVRRAYGAVAAGEPIVTIGSHGNVELAANRARGDDRFHLESGDAVELTGR